MTERREGQGRKYRRKRTGPKTDGRIRAVLAAALVLVWASGCGGSGGETGQDSRTCLRLAGSTSMEKMTEALAEGFMAKYPRVTVTVEYIGSSAGAEALIEGKADIANLSRNVGSEEKERGVTENVVALDGIVICTDSSNPLTDLTTQQLRDIYTGKITRWSRAGGDDVPVVTVGREAGSGTRAAFEELLGIEGRCLYANIMDSSGAVTARAACTPGVIGYISLDTVSDRVRVLSVDGRTPSLENIRTGEYFLTRSCIMATKGEISAQSPLVQAWFRYLYSEEGKQIIENAGLVPAE